MLWSDCMHDKATPMIQYSMLCQYCYRAAAAKATLLRNPYQRRYSVVAGELQQRQVLHHPSQVNHWATVLHCAHHVAATWWTVLRYHLHGLRTLMMFLSLRVVLPLQPVSANPMYIQSLPSIQCLEMAKVISIYDWFNRCCSSALCSDNRLSQLCMC